MPRQTVCVGSSRLGLLLTKPARQSKKAEFFLFFKAEFFCLFFGGFVLFCFLRGISTAVRTRTGGGTAHCVTSLNDRPAFRCSLCSSLRRTLWGHVPEPISSLLSACRSPCRPDSGCHFALLGLCGFFFRRRDGKMCRRLFRPRPPRSIHSFARGWCCLWHGDGFLFRVEV